MTFEIVAREWHRERIRIYSAQYAEHADRLLGRDILAWVGKQPPRKRSMPPMCSIA